MGTSGINKCKALDSTETHCISERPGYLQDLKHGTHGNLRQRDNGDDDDTNYSADQSLCEFSRKR